MASSVTSTKIIRIGPNGQENAPDLVANEEPLEIRLGIGSANEREQLSLSVTMRTPGHDKELALGFLFTEGIINSFDDVSSIEYCQTVKTEEAENVIRVELRPTIQLDADKLSRHFYTTSSCGVCGKSSIDAVQVPIQPLKDHFQKVDSKVVCQLPKLLEDAQMVFEHTGGLHACGLFSSDGKLLELREDVGRHNAVDKLVGVLLSKKMLPASDAILMLSGRVSFELVQKAARAGINFIAAIGAPSSLAIEMAKKHDITMVGFLKNSSFNIYSGEKRIEISKGTCQ
ncbi:MAG: formate dehydrogenase accessory sulfurtransferase FdhD [Cyclobacteriaceae bacterium]|nr:formate dehydrogenase accessory sulfurtransferase FdhD [Cyclobacteriaceae bacterium]